MFSHCIGVSVVYCHIVSLYWCVGVLVVYWNVVSLYWCVGVLVVYWNVVSLYWCVVIVLVYCLVSCDSLCVCRQPMVPRESTGDFNPSKALTKRSEFNQHSLSLAGMGDIIDLEDRIFRFSSTYHR